VVPLPSLAFPLYRELRLVPPWVRLSERLETFRPHLVHVLNPISLGAVGSRWARSHRLPLVASYHTDLPGYVRRYGFGLLTGTTWALLRRLHNQADLNLVPSQATLRELAQHGFERLAVWVHGVDSCRFHPRHHDPVLRRRLASCYPSGPLLLFVGRLATEKRVEALLPVVRAFPGANLAIVGDGPQRPRLERLFAGTATTFTGYLRGDDLAHAYASADAFVFPSDSETFGNVVVEAMASGLPVVAAAAGGPLELVEEGRTGFLVDPGDPAALVRAVGLLLADPQLARRLGQAGRLRAEGLSWPQVLDGVLSAYEHVMAEHPRPRRAPLHRGDSSSRGLDIPAPEVTPVWPAMPPMVANQGAAVWLTRRGGPAGREGRPCPAG
jgi:glycosyltransferase involved in cell wall biosynthesis